MSPFKALIYGNAVLAGFVVMAFEMLGSRYLNPYFGSGIFTWAALITVVMIALAIGYFCGGIVADRFPTARLLGGLVLAASVWLALIPLFYDPVLGWVFERVDDSKYASLIGATLILLLPLTLLGMYSPYAVRLLMINAGSSGKVSGTLYAISTVGSVLGTLVTTFYLIPTIGTKMITYALAGLGGLSGLSLLLHLKSWGR